MAEAEASAAEASEAEAAAARRRARRARARPPTLETRSCRERRRSPSSPPIHGAAFAALEAGEEAKMEAAERARAGARRGAQPARGELDALRELSLASRRAAAPRRAAGGTRRRRASNSPSLSPTATPHGSVFDEPHASVASPMRPAGVTVVQMMTDDETDTASEAPGRAPSAERRRDARDRRRARRVRGGPGVVPLAHLVPSRLLASRASPRTRSARTRRRALAGVRGSSSEEDDVVRMSSEDEGRRGSTPGRGGAARRGRRAAYA